MTVEALDISAVVPDRGTYSTTRANPDDPQCHCHGVPPGQHIADCVRSKTPDAITCPGCGYRTATITIEDAEPRLVCGGCGTTKRKLAMAA